jgi:hypothetical protein
VVAGPEAKEQAPRERWSHTGWRLVVRERLGQIMFEPHRLAQRTFQRLVLDPLYFKTGFCPVHQRDLSGYSHFVTSREGLFAINQTSCAKVVSGQFFGLTWRDGAFYAFESLGPYRPPERSEEGRYRRGRLVRIEIEGSRVSRVHTVFSGLSNGVHQIEFIGGHLYLVDTYNNRILRMPSDLSRVDAEFYPIGRARQEDWANGYAHMNSILGRDGSIFLLKHNGRPDKATRPSEVIRCDSDFNILETIELNGNACHNIVFLEDGSLLSCGSHNGEIIDGQKVIAKISDMFTRGLSVDADSVVVGSSIYTIRTGKHGRRYVPGRVMFFDRDYELHAELSVPAAPTDIRRIDARDRGLSSFDGTA